MRSSIPPTAAGPAGVPTAPSVQGEVKVLLMSGYSSADLLARGVRATCGMLAKPFSADELLAQVRVCLDRAGRQEA